MAIRDEQRFRENTPAGFDGLFDWDFLNKCWPRGIRPCDVDAQVEIGGHFLKFETKSPPSNPLQTTERGQAQTIVRSMQCSGQYLTYILMQGKKAEEIGWVWVVRYESPGGYNPGKWQVWLTFGIEKLIELCTHWASMADKAEILPLYELGPGWEKKSLPKTWLSYQLNGK